MPHFLVHIDIALTVEVEADDEDNAITLALEDIPIASPRHGKQFKLDWEAKPIERRDFWTETL